MAFLSVHVRQAGESDDCKEWKGKAAMTGYDNWDRRDDRNVGCLNDYCFCDKKFVEERNVASVDVSDWDRFKFHNIQVHQFWYMIIIVLAYYRCMAVTQSSGL